MENFDQRNINLGDLVTIATRNSDYGKMCEVIEASETNALLPVKVRLINPHDYFKNDVLNAGVIEKWIPRVELLPAERR